MDCSDSIQDVYWEASTGNLGNGPLPDPHQIFRTHQVDDTMADLSKDELERLRQLEEEVDRERAAIRKQQEDIARQSEARADDPSSRDKVTRTAVVEKNQTTAIVIPAVNRIGIRNKILVGAAGVMGALFLIQNAVTLFGMAVLLGAGYVGLNKYFVSSDIPAEEEKEP